MPANEDKPATPSFEAGIDELERIVKQMEAGDLPLERAIELFEKGMNLSDQCRRQLDAAETRVEILMQRGDKIVPKPFAPGSTEK